MRYIAFVKLSAEGRQRFTEADKIFAETIGISEKAGGKVLESFALGGKYDFVSISEYPTPEAAFEAHVKHIEQGVFESFDYYEAFDMDLFLSKV